MKKGNKKSDKKSVKKTEVYYPVFKIFVFCFFASFFVLMLFDLIVNWLEFEDVFLASVVIAVIYILIAYLWIKPSGVELYKQKHLKRIK